MLSQVKRLVGDSFLYAFMSLGTKLIAFIMYPIYTHYLGLAEIGVLGIIDTTIAMLTFFIIFGTDSALAYYYFEEKDPKKKLAYVQNVMGFRLGVAGLLTTVVFLGGEMISTLLFESTAYVHALHISLVTLLIDTIVILAITIFRYEMKSIRVVSLTILKMLLIAGISYFLLVYQNGDLESILYGRAVSVTVILLLCGKSVLTFLYVSFKKEVLVEVLKYATPLVPATIAFWVIGSSNRYILLALDPGKLETVGIFDAAFRIASVISLVTYGIQMAWRPYSMQIKNKENSKELLSKIYLAIFVLGMAGIMTVTAVMPWGIQILDEKFWISYQYVGFLSLGTFLSFYYLIISSGLLFTKQTKPISYAFMIGALINVGLNLLLVPIWSIWGSIVANLVTYTFAVAYIFYKSQQVYPIPVATKKLLFLFLQTIIAAGGMVYLQTHDQYSVLYQLIPWGYFVGTLFLCRVDRDFRIQLKASK